MKKVLRSIASIVSLSALLMACNSGQDEVKQTENEVFAIHDEVMPKIDDILKLQKQLKQRISAIDSLKSSGSAAAAVRTDEEKEQATRLSRDLTVSYDLMMDWMHGYNGDTLAKLSSDEGMRYLNAQKDQITDVKTKVNSSIEQAHQFLGKK